MNALESASRTSSTATISLANAGVAGNREPVPSPGGRSRRWWVATRVSVGWSVRVRAISSTSRRATTRHPGRRLGRIGRGVMAGCARGAARSGVARSRRWRFGPDVSGVFPERTTHLSPARVGTRRHEPAAQTAQGGTARSSRSRRVRLDTVEVTAVPSTVDQRRRRRVKCTCTHPSTPAPRRGDGGLRCERRAKARGIGHSRPGSWDGSWDELQTLGGRRGPERPSKGPGRTLGDAAAHAGSRPPEAVAQVRILPGARKRSEHQQPDG